MIERRLIGKVAAKFRTNPQPGARVIIESAGNFAVVMGGGADAGAVDVIEPLDAIGHVQLRGHMQHEDVVRAPPLAGADAGDVVLPAIVGLNDLGQVFVPVLLNANFKSYGRVSG